MVSSCKFFFLNPPVSLKKPKYLFLKRTVDGYDKFSWLARPCHNFWEHLMNKVRANIWRENLKSPSWNEKWPRQVQVRSNNNKDSWTVQLCFPLSWRQRKSVIDKKCAEFGWAINARGIRIPQQSLLEIRPTHKITTDRPVKWAGSKCCQQVSITNWI